MDRQVIGQRAPADIPVQAADGGRETVAGPDGDGSLVHYERRAAGTRGSHPHAATAPASGTDATIGARIMG